MCKRDRAQKPTRRGARLPLSALIVFAAALLGGCEPQAVEQNDNADPGALAPADALILASAKIGLPPDGLTENDLPDPLGAGAAALQAYCTECHALPAPWAHSATDWPPVLRRMWLRMGPNDADFAVPAPSAAERIVLSEYLTGNALRVAEMQLPELAGYGAFESACSVCHELPDPRQHSSEDWAAVVRRMSGHMEDILGEALPREGYEEITGYLQVITNR